MLMLKAASRCTARIAGCRIIPEHYFRPSQLTSSDKFADSDSEGESRWLEATKARGCGWITSETTELAPHGMRSFSALR